MSIHLLICLSMSKKGIGRTPATPSINRSSFSPPPPSFSSLLFLPFFRSALPIPFYSLSSGRQSEPKREVQKETRKKKRVQDSDRPAHLFTPVTHIHSLSAYGWIRKNIGKHPTDMQINFERSKEAQ
mmetsp:Transcript_13121/g.25798  ORF Transcript_13121/g.25798 Transcript_13121/m.25798 type:complete len:127 (-) Transcript_13121:740-1120(-)